MLGGGAGTRDGLESAVAWTALRLVVRPSLDGFPIPETCMTSDAVDYDPLYLKGIEFFNACDYFEAHEAWEELWTDYRGELRRFYQGLIQVAVALATVLFEVPRRYTSAAETTYSSTNLAARDSTWRSSSGSTRSALSK